RVSFNCLLCGDPPIPCDVSTNDRTPVEYVNILPRCRSFQVMAQPRRRERPAMTVGLVACIRAHHIHGENVLIDLPCALSSCQFLRIGRKDKQRPTGLQYAIRFAYKAVPVT